MAIIVIKDLPESVDLDRQAMLAITGGARVRGRPSGVRSSLFRSLEPGTGQPALLTGKSLLASRGTAREGGRSK